jgi:hypothetical protein
MEDKLIEALIGVVNYVTTQRCQRFANHYKQKPIEFALRTLCEATGNSQEGYDWLDVIDRIKEKAC